MSRKRKQTETPESVDWAKFIPIISAIILLIIELLRRL